MAAIGINLAIGLGASFLLSLFEPTQKIEGPRLSDLSAPKSNYGSGIPIIWGKARVGGNLIWATKIREVVKKSRKRGKGLGPKVQTTNYTYFANFAVMFCRGPIVRVQRVWLNGKLVYAHGGTANGFFNTYARIYTGTGSQNPDPMLSNTNPVVHNDYGFSSDPATRAAQIADYQSRYGVNISNQTPGYRSRAYIVFEGLPLADYNNAIPTVSAEIVADEAVNLQQIIEELCAEAGMKPGEYDASALSGIPVTGFIIKNIQSINAALEELQTAYFFDVIRTQGVLKFVPQDRGRSLVEPDASLLASHAGGTDRPDDYEKEVITIETLPSEVNVTFLDPAEDFAENTAIYRRQRALPDNKKDVSVALVLTVDQARQMAERLLFQQWIEERVKFKMTFPPAMLHVEAGDLVRLTIGGQATDVEVRRVQVGANLLVEHESTLSDKSFLNYVRTLPVNPIESDIQVESDTILRVFDMNLVSDGDVEGLYYTGTGEGTWRFGYLFASFDNLNYSLVNTIDTKGVLGTVVGTLRDALPWVLDTITVLEVQLRSGDTLESVSDSQLDFGLNKALVGDEIIQFGNAVFVGSNRWQLSKLRRGIRGTAQYTTGHSANENFTLFTGDDAFLQIQEGTVSDVGRTYYFKALNSFQTIDQVSPTTMPIVGNAYRPYAPTGVVVSRIGNDLVVNWQRHTRRNGRWQDGGDIAIVSTESRCLVEIYNGATLVQNAIVSGNSYTYTEADQLSDFGSVQSSLSLRIYQLNDAVINGFRGYPFSGVVGVSRRS